jgi:hypothetical protein
MEADKMLLEDVRKAVEQLARSDKGRSAMRHLLKWLEDDGLSLDHENQAAAVTVLKGAWGAWAGTTRDLLREAIRARKPRRDMLAECQRRAGIDLENL